MWITEEAVQHLHAVRYAFERGRLLIEMCRQREKQKKRIIQANLFPLLRNSIEIIITKRPCQSMKSVYAVLTGESLIEPRPVVRCHKSVVVHTKGEGKRSVRQNTSQNSGQRARKAKDTAGLAMSDLRRSTRHLEDKMKKLTPPRDTATRRMSDTLCESPQRKRQRREKSFTAAQVISAFRDFSEQELDFDEVIPQRYPELA